MPISVEESVRRLRERAELRRAEREQRGRQTRDAAIRAVPAALPEKGRAWLIGSVVWGGFGERSDVDVVLAGVTGPEATRIEDAVARATGVEVDVLELRCAPCHFPEAGHHRGGSRRWLLTLPPSLACRVSSPTARSTLGHSTRAA